MWGFTLIELLVVISIISLLSSVVFSSLSDARVKARDVVRKSDFSEIQKALELYHLDHGGYPYGQPSSETSVCASDWECWIGTGLANDLKPYIKSLPQDPKFYTTESGDVTCGNWFAYVYERKSANSYCIGGTLEESKDKAIKSCEQSCHSVWPNYYILRN